MSATVGNTVLLVWMAPQLLLPMVLHIMCLLYLRRKYLTTQQQYQPLLDKGQDALTYN